jgi:hypothetical protein
MDLIEQYPGESDEQLKAWLEDFLLHLPAQPRGQWWTPFTLGKKYAWGGKQFSRFECTAGSLFAHIAVAAQRKQHHRTIIFVGMRLHDHSLVGLMTCDGNDSEIDPKDIGEKF